ncbi:MAG: SMC family ATPase, partial [Clostridia bacterium]|nr:SMC family ATPase [Clostridia bacterium]
MKPVYLEFCGINSFSQKAVIDFAKLLSGGVFGIFGDTGSGKSTILDCIHLALYGKIDRAVGSQNDCINYRLDGAYVIFDFEITYQGKRRLYRVHRERKRKVSGNKAHLYERQGEEWLAVAEGLQDVDDKLGEIIGLSFDDFKKCIALPQGEFAGLVKSTNAERMRLVSRLFDLEKYGERLSKKVRAKCDLTQKEIEILEGRLQENAEGKEENVAQKKGELDECVRVLAEAETRLRKAQDEYEKSSRDYAEKVRYETLCKEVSALEEKQAHYARLQEKAEKVPLAKTLIAAESARKAAAEEKQRAYVQVAQATAMQVQAEEAKKSAERALKEGGFDEKIWRIDEGLKTLSGAQADRKLLQEAQEKYQACKERYKSIADDNRDFEKLLKETEKSLAELDKAGSLEEYLTTHFKGVLLKKEY